jgi:hypothetical protein
MKQLPAQSVLNNWLVELQAHVDCGDDYIDHAFVTLPHGETLLESLGVYFESFTPLPYFKPQPAAAWKIRLGAACDAKQHLFEAANSYLNNLRTSLPADHPIMVGRLEAFYSMLNDAVGDAPAFEVFVAPPVWYEASWRDFAFDAGDVRWLLHFGISD